MSSDQQHNDDNQQAAPISLIGTILSVVCIAGPVVGGVILGVNSSGQLVSRVYGAFYGGFGGFLIAVVILAPAIGRLVRIASNVGRYLAGEWLVRGAARMLPSVARQEAVEEWTAWLRDLRADGMPWHRRLVEVLSIVLVAVPRLAVTLWLRRRQAVDR